jgi:hypothetical protein
MSDGEEIKIDMNAGSTTPKAAAFGGRTPKSSYHKGGKSMTSTPKAMMGAGTCSKSGGKRTRRNKRKLTPWNHHVKKTFTMGRKSNTSFTFKDALKKAASTWKNRIDPASGIKKMLKFDKN